MFLKCVLLSCDIKLFHEKSTCEYSFYSKLFPHAKSKEILIGSDIYFAVRFPELTTQIVAVNRRLRPVSSVPWLPFDMGKILKRKRNPTNQPIKNSTRKTTPCKGMKGGEERWSAYQCADFTAG